MNPIPSSDSAGRGRQGQVRKSRYALVSRASGLWTTRVCRALRQARANGSLDCLASSLVAKIARRRFSRVHQSETLRKSGSP